MMDESLKRGDKVRRKTTAIFTAWTEHLRSHGLTSDAVLTVESDELSNGFVDIEIIGQAWWAINFEKVDH